MPGIKPVDLKDIPQIRPQRVSATRGINPARVPKWARSLIAEVCHEYNLPTPPVRWINRDRDSSSGARYREHIVISAGRDVRDQRVTLLHELAHWALPMRERHSQLFWAVAWDMFKVWLEPEDLTYAYTRSKNYRKKAAWLAPRKVAESAQ